jgi:hypothetical protein
MNRFKVKRINGVLLLSVLLGMFFFAIAANAIAETPPSHDPGVSAATSAASQVDFQKLKGKWLRPDGGYVLEIKGVAADGTLNATYNNPSPIHVSKAEVTRDGATVKVFVELRDVNYPGCTYKLSYDTKSDSLTGIYYQAAMQQQFEIVFIRIG